MARYRDLVAFIGDNGRFVAEVSDALKLHGHARPGGTHRADTALVDAELAASDAERLDGLERSLIIQGVHPEVAAAVTAEVAAALRADPTVSFGAATRAGFAGYQGISIEEAERVERSFSLSPPEVAAVLGEHYDEIAGRHGNEGHVTIEDLRDAVGDESLPPEVRDVAYRLAADSIMFNNLDVAKQTDLSSEPLANGFAWHEADGTISRDDVAQFPAKDHQARILLAWHPLVETAGQGYDLTKADSHATSGDVTAFIEDDDIPVYIRLAVFDVYADRHHLTVTEREVLEQELAFDGTTIGRGTYLDVRQGPSQARTAPIAPTRTGPSGPLAGGGGRVAAAAIAAHLLIAGAKFGWNQGRHRPRGQSDHRPHRPVDRARDRLDPAELVGLSSAEAYVAHFAVHGTAPPEGTDRIEPHPYLDPLGQWRMSATNEPVWTVPPPGQFGRWSKTFGCLSATCLISVMASRGSRRRPRTVGGTIPS